ncbi:MAG: hypothetical protein OXH46_00960 [Gemmatimonadetes bacterium]|nr:hypothetical protein [Gemmatimonadota bacterium]
MPYSPRADLTCGALLLLAGLLACGSEGDFTELRIADEREVVDVSASLEALIGSGVRIGAEVNPASEAEAFQRILDAQLTPDGRFIVALDASQPFVRVFNPDGSLKTAFLPRGQGPGEAESPEALAVANDRILVLEPGRASVLTLDGELVDDRPIDFWPTSAARGCADDFLVYGSSAYDDGSIVWLRSFRTTPVSILEGASEAEVSAYRRRDRGRPSRLARAGELAVLHHDARDPPETFTLSCPGVRTSTVDTVPEFTEPVVGREQRVTSGAVRTLQLGSYIFTGAAILNRTPILSAWKIVESGTESGTHFIPARGGSPALYTSSRVALLDAQPNQAVLLEASFPVPHIIMVDYDAFVRALGVEPH